MIIKNHEKVLKMKMKIVALLAVLFISCSALHL